MHRTHCLYSRKWIVLAERRFSRNCRVETSWYRTSAACPNFDLCECLLCLCDKVYFPPIYPVQRSLTCHSILYFSVLPNCVTSLMSIATAHVITVQMFASYAPISPCPLNVRASALACLIYFASIDPRSPCVRDLMGSIYSADVGAAEHPSLTYTLCRRTRFRLPVIVDP